MPASDKTESFDAIVIGTGFGGAVTACRLVEAGFKICVLERGRRYGPDDFPKYPDRRPLRSRRAGTRQFTPPPDFSRWLWGRDHGIYDIRDLDDAVSVQAAGYGGGSLIYANVHLRPPREVFDEEWPEEYTVDEQGWSLDAYFDLAAYMLRVVADSAAARQDHAVARRPPRRSRRPAHALVSHAAGGQFREAPTRTPPATPQQACDMRGRCWLGCDQQAKNTLDRNYLARAEEGGAKA